MNDKNIRLSFRLIWSKSNNIFTLISIHRIYLRTNSNNETINGRMSFLYIKFKVISPCHDISTFLRSILHSTRPQTSKQPIDFIAKYNFAIFFNLQLNTEANKVKANTKVKRCSDKGFQRGNFKLGHDKKRFPKKFANIIFDDLTLLNVLTSIWDL